MRLGFILIAGVVILATVADVVCRAVRRWMKRDLYNPWESE